MSTFQGYIVNDNCYYKVQSDGNAPPNLSAGDLVVTGAGTYLITKVNLNTAQQSQYTAILYDRSITIYNFQGVYLNPPTYSKEVLDASYASSTESGSSIIGNGLNSGLKSGKTQL